MLKALRELGEFALSIFFDLFELIHMLQVPVIASSTYGIDKARALQLSALVTIVTLIAWAGTSHSSDVDWTTIGIISTLYFSFSAWVIHKYLDATVQYEAKGDLKLDALSIVLTFNLVVIFIATSTRELNFYMQLEQPGGIPALSTSALRAVMLALPVFFAGCIVIVNSVRYAKARSSHGKDAYVQIGLFTLLNAILSDIYLYIIFVLMLPS